MSVSKSEKRSSESRDRKAATGKPLQESRDPNHLRTIYGPLTTQSPPPPGHFRLICPRSHDSLAPCLPRYSPLKGKGVVKLLVGNKCDLLEGDSTAAAVTPEEADSWARDNGMLYLQSSAKNKEGVQQCFMEVVRRILENPELLANTAPGKPRITLQPEPQGGAAGGCC